MNFFSGEGAQPPPQTPLPHPTTSASRPPPSEILNTPLYPTADSNQRRVGA